MKKFLICMWLTFSVSKCLWATSLAWDYDFTTSNATGFKIYENSVFGKKTIDVGNFLTFKLTDVKPGVNYAFYVTAYNAEALESDPSNTLTWSEPIPTTTLEMAGAGTIIAHTFPGDFELQTSSDLKTWSVLQEFTAVNPITKVSPPSTNPQMFFRLKYIIPSPMETAVKMLRQSIRAAAVPGLPPLPAPTQPKIKFSNKVRYWWHDKMFKLSYALKYKPGHHPDMKKGAEVMTGRKP